MTRIITVSDVQKLIHKVTLKDFFLKLIDQLKSDYSRWKDFEKSPRHAIKYPQGIIELMPISDKEYYAFKYVNGHPENTKLHLQTVVAVGQLSLAETGYPVLISEMTLLTAFRTAATSALASLYLAKKGAKTFGIIGTGAQSEFQVLAHHFALGINDIFYFDIDVAAMDKFAHNLKSFPLQLHRCEDGKSVIEKSDIITTATAQKGHHQIIHADWIKKGIHINKIGGDSPGKTELDPALVARSKIVVELAEQTKIEGEIQQLKNGKTYTELWEIITDKKKGRETNEEITLFDSVGFALEDYSVLRLVYRLAKKYSVGHKLTIIPNIEDPKNLFGALL
jgi:ornithine cyclodeaminase